MPFIDTQFMIRDTTIELNRHKIGNTLMELLLNRISNNNLPIQKVVFKTRLIKRESTAKNKLLLDKK